MFESANRTASELELGTLVKKMLTKLCPIYKQPCLGIDCMSYNKGDILTYQKRIVIDDGKPTYEEYHRVREPRCDSPLVTGYIEAEMIEP